MLLKPLLSKRAKKAAESATFASSYSSALTNDQMTTQGSVLAAGDGNFSHADAERVTTLLLEQSRRCKSGFFKTQKPRRPLKDRRILSESCLLNGIEAPTSTPDMLHLSRYPSTGSTGSASSCLEMGGGHTSKVSLAHTDSTSAEVEPQVKASLEVPQDTKQSKPENPVPVSTSPPPANRCLHRSLSFHGRTSLLQAKVRKVANAFQVWVPSRRAKIREGKQQALDFGYPPVVRRTPRPPPREYLETAFLRPSTSREFEKFKLDSGKEAPKCMSEKDLDRLDEIDKEEAQKLRELVSLRKEKEMILRRTENEKYQVDSKRPKDSSKKEPKKDKDKKVARQEERKSSALIPGVNLFNRGFAT